MKKRLMSQEFEKLNKALCGGWNGTFLGGVGNSLKPSHNQDFSLIEAFSNLALWGEKKFVSELKRTYKFQRGVNNRLDCHANQTRILSKEYSFVAGDYVRSTARNDVNCHTEDNSPKYRMVGNDVGPESPTHRNNCSEYRKTVITRSDKRHSNLILLIPHLEIKDFGPPASGGHGSYHCLTNVVNRLRNKCAMTSVGDMKENNFFDKVYSLFTTHHSLKRAGATHVALCESVGSYFRHWCGAFTLAEVLITLGIIGVVAAMTMQIIITNIQDKQLTAMWKKKYSEISSIYYQVREEMDGGDICVESKSGGYANVIKCSKIKQWSGYGTLSPEFVEKFVAKLKVIDSCGFAEFGEAKKCQNFYFKWVGYCDWTAAGGYYGTLIQNRGQKGSISGTSCMSPGGLYTAWDMNKKAVLLADGSVIYFGGHATGMISVDVNGFGKGPNVLGRDLFVVMVNEDWIRPIGADETFDKNANGDICKCSKDYGVERGQGILGSTNLLNGRVLSGACCSATKLYE